MANIQEKIFSETLKNLGMEESNILISKAKEIHDIVGIKCGSIVALNDQAKVIICLDISCELLNVAFDLPTAIKSSTLRKSKYHSYRNILMRLMNLTKKLKVKDVVLKLGITNGNVEKTATKIYDSYAKTAVQTDLDHPQYLVMSVYQACKSEKVKAAKKILIPLSNLKPNQWSQLEKSWDKFVGSLVNLDKENLKGGLKKAANDEQPTNGTELKRKHEAEPEIEDYDVWAKRTLDKARADLKAGIP